MHAMLGLLMSMAEIAGLAPNEINDILDEPEPHLTDRALDDLGREDRARALLAEAAIVAQDAAESLRELFDDLELDYDDALAALELSDDDAATP